MVFLSRMSNRIFLTVLSILLPFRALSQTEAFTANLKGLLILVVIILVIVSIVVCLVTIYTSHVLNNLLLNEKRKEAALTGVEPKPMEGLLQSLSRSLTKSTPLKEEKTILLDHDYDGIKELDNHLPPWWKALFYFTIIWAAIYLLVYHVYNLLPLSAEEYNLEIAEVNAELKAQQAKLSESINENTIELSNDPVVLSSGESVFNLHCSVCHAADGGGGIGPNLTDEYWLHGGSIKNIFWVIKYGVPDKGMISWQRQLSPIGIRDVASYIITLGGTSPANPKEPQGKLHDETAPVVIPEKPAVTDMRSTITTVSDTMNNIQIGRGLFSGSIRLMNGGPGCITCHHVTEDMLPAGALIAPDLTNVYSRLDEKTIMKYATNPYHPTMQEAYKEKPVIKEEVTCLISFFEYVGTATVHQQQRDKRAASFLDRIKKN